MACGDGVMIGVIVPARIEMHNGVAQRRQFVKQGVAHFFPDFVALRDRQIAALCYLITPYVLVYRVHQVTPQACN